MTTIKKVGEHGSSVSVVRRPKRTNYYLRYWTEGRPRYLSAHTRNLPVAVRAAEALHERLQNGGVPKRADLRMAVPHDRRRFSWVYFIGGAGMIKIGVTRNPRQRLATLSAASPVPLVLLGAMRGTAQTEEKIHRKFGFDRSHGEWFYESDELYDFIHSNCRALKDLKGEVVNICPTSSAADPAPPEDR